MAPVTHYVGQSALLLLDYGQVGTVKNIGKDAVFIGGADIDVANDGSKLARGRTFESDGTARVYSRAYTVDPAAVDVEVTGTYTAPEPEPDPST